MFYTLHVVEPLRYDSVLIKETNEMNEWSRSHSVPIASEVMSDRTVL